MGAVGCFVDVDELKDAVELNFGALRRFGALKYFGALKLTDAYFEALENSVKNYYAGYFEKTVNFVNYVGCL